MTRSKGSGGPRQGKLGTQYPNRSDLRANASPLAAKTLPISTPPSAQYGQRVALEQSQRAVPITAPAGSPANPLPAGPAAAPMPPQPGSLGDLIRPTERPQEPVTAGIATGPGPGPEALGFGTASGLDALLSSLRDSSSEVGYLADYFGGGRL